jgi:hypothetical protein
MTIEETSKLEAEKIVMSKDLDDFTKASAEIDSAKLFEAFLISQFFPDPIKILSTHCQRRGELTKEFLLATEAFMLGLKDAKPAK